MNKPIPGEDNYASKRGAYILERLRAGATYATVARELNLSTARIPQIAFNAVKRENPEFKFSQFIHHRQWIKAAIMEGYK